MSFQPFEVASAIHYFIDPRLEEEDGEKGRGEDLEKVACALRSMKTWHPLWVGERAAGRISLSCLTES